MRSRTRACLGPRAFQRSASRDPWVWCRRDGGDMSKIPWPLIALITALVGCSCDGGTDNGETGLTTADGETLIWLDSINYSYTAELTLDVLDMQAAADCVIDWSGIDTDYRGRPLDPTDVDRVTIASISLTHDELIAKINAND